MSTQPLEDINAIVSRFHAWAGAQASARQTDGVRELSYEEAARPKPRRVSLKDSPSVRENAAAVTPTKAKRSAKAKSTKPASAPRHPRRDSQMNKPTGPLPEASVAAPVPVFRQVLAESVAILPAMTRPPASEPRTTALSLRLSPAESALFRRRAAETNVSVSAYLRQCALEVEVLRARLKQPEVSATVLTPHRSGIFGVLGQFMRGVFGTRAPALRLRA